MSKLREQTRDAHNRLEQASPLFAADLDRPTYLGWLVRLYGFVLPLEEKLALVPDWHTTGIDFPERRKAHLLARDLETLGMTSSSRDRLPLCKDLPRVTPLPRALGCLYVFEGATLGGRVIALRLERSQPDIVAGAMAYHQSYGAAVPTMWHTFKECLETFAKQHDEIIGEMIDAANECFCMLERWIARPRKGVAE